MCNNQHPWEAVGLGKAPFRVVGVNEIVFKVPGEPPRAGGSCDYCGTGIRWAYQIQASDARTFKVGCDCVAKVDLELYKETKRIRREFERTRFAEVSAKKRLEARIERRIKWRFERHEKLGKHINLIGALFEVREDVWCRNTLLKLLNGYWTASDELAEKVAREIERAYRNRIEKEVQATSIHVGKVGERLTLELHCLKKISGGDRYNPWTLSILTDGKNIFTTFGNCPLWAGDKAKVKATVKGHNERDGVKQTQIIRIKEVK